MRKLLFLIILVIILVSLNWFRELLAQDLSAISDQDKAALLKKYHTKLADSKNLPPDNTYRSPSIYEPSDSLPTTAGPVKGSKTKFPIGVDTLTVGKDHLTPFENLKPFGQELFGGPRESTPPTDIASSSDYVLGPGDNVLVSLWGRVEQEYNLTVDREGKVFIPKVGEITAWGKTLDDFKGTVNKRLSAVFSEFEMNVSLGKIRSIRIYVTGEVNLPGAYTVSSLTSLFNALFLAGGPNDNGSMRDIRLMRGGKPVATLDLYRFLLEGNNTCDVRLETGDAVFVPVAGARVAIRGEIRRPAIYELKSNETAPELLTLAGNPTPQAYLDRVQLERVSTKGEWEVLDLALNKNTTAKISNLTLKDGDRMTVYSMYDVKSNMVSVAGKVKHPGCYERNDSTRISDLLQRGQLQDYDVYYDRADLFRLYADHRVEVISIDLRALRTGDQKQNILLADRDSLHVYAIQDVQRDRQVYIGGEIKRPGMYPLYDRMTVNDLIFLAGSFTRAASRLQAEIARTDSLGEVKIDYVALNDSLSLHTVLKEDDRLYVRTIPEWELHRTVKIDGEVQFPGEYVLSDRDETLFGLLKRTGGFTHSAFPKGIVFERGKINRDLQRLQIPRVLENSKPIVKDSLGREEDQMVIAYDSSLVNRIVIDLDRIMASNGAAGDLVLQPGDHIYIPPVPSGISVMGAVGSTGTIKFDMNKKVKYYINAAGSFTPRADKNATRLIKANGAVYSGRGVLGKQVEIGDVIVVPGKIQQEHDWLKTVTTTLAATTSLLTTLLVITKL
jgi:protein involved in polysaccharide export with SLBB domain